MAGRVAPFWPNRSPVRNGKKSLNIVLVKGVSESNSKAVDFFFD